MSLSPSHPSSSRTLPRRIALLRLSAAGDVVMMVPTVKALIHHFPEATVTWIISDPAYQLVSGLEGVDFWVVDKPRSLVDYLAFWRQARKRRFDVLLAAQASLRANLMILGIRASQKWGFDRTRARDGHRWCVNKAIPFTDGHIADSFFSFAQVLGVPRPQRLDFSFPVNDAEHQWCKGLALGDYVAINPAASKAERNWPIERYVSLIAEIRQRWPSFSIVLTGSPADSDLSMAIAAQQPVVKDFTGRTSLPQLAALLKHAALLIAPDTGPAHIANAMETPVVGLYAVAPGKLSAPYNSRQLLVDKYSQAVVSILGKDPASVPWGTRVHDPKAMLLISVEEVLAKVAMVLPA